MLPLLAPANAAGTPRAVFWRDGHYQAVQVAGWKLQMAARPDKVWLFNLDEDPTERTNLAAKRPDKVAELKDLIARHNATQREPLFPAAGEMPVLIDKTLDHASTRDDEYVYWPG